MTAPRLVLALLGVILPGAFAACRAPGSQTAFLSWKSPDDLRLRGRLYQGGDDTGAAVVLVHSVERDHTDWHDLALRLQARGLAVLAVDLRGHGRSKAQEGPSQAVLANSDYARMAWDVQSAVAALRTHLQAPDLRVALVGASVGATVALNAAVGDTPTDALALVSPVMSYRSLTAAEAAERYTGALFLAAAHDDKHFADAEALRALAEQARVTWEALEGEGHGVSILAGPGGPALTDRLIDFVVEALGLKEAAPAAPPTGDNGEQGQGDAPQVVKPPALPLPTPIARERSPKTPAAAAADSTPLRLEHEALKDRVSVLEKRLAELSHAPASEAPLSMTSAAESALRLSGADRSWRMGAHLEAAYQDPSGKFSDRFAPLRAGLLLSARPVEGLSLRAEFEWAGEFTNPGDEAGLRVQEARMDFRPVSFFGVAGGVVRVPLGFVNDTVPGAAQPLISRPLMSRTVAPAPWRDAGLGVSGAFSVGRERFEYESFAINGLSEAISDVAGYDRAVPGLSLGGDGNDDKTFVGRVIWRSSLVEHLALALSGLYGAWNPEGDAQTSLGAAGASWSRGNFEVRAEGALGVNERDRRVRPVPHQMHGFFAQGAYHFWFSALDETPLGGHGGKERFEVALRYDYVDTDRAAHTQGDRRTVSIGLAYRPMPSTAIKVEYRFDADSGRVENLDEDRALFVGLATFF